MLCFGTRNGACWSKIESDEIQLLDTEVSYKNMSTLHGRLVLARSKLDMIGWCGAEVQDSKFKC